MPNGECVLGDLTAQIDGNMFGQGFLGSACVLLTLVHVVIASMTFRGTGFWPLPRPLQQLDLLRVCIMYM